jgi:hypothetical protein
MTEDYVALSLMYRGESISGIVLYWDKDGHIVHAFNKQTDTEIMHGTPESALMRYVLSVARNKPNPKYI